MAFLKKEKIAAKVAQECTDSELHYKTNITTSHPKMHHAHCKKGMFDNHVYGVFKI